MKPFLNKCQQTEQCNLLQVYKASLYRKIRQVHDDVNLSILTNIQMQADDKRMHFQTKSSHTDIIRIENIKMLFLYTLLILFTCLKGNPLIWKNPKTLKNIVPAVVSNLADRYMWIKFSARSKACGVRQIAMRREWDENISNMGWNFGKIFSGFPKNWLPFLNSL